MSLTFVAIQVTVRTKVRAIIKESAERTGKAVEHGRASRAIESALLARLVEENPAFLSAINPRGEARPTLIEHQLRRLRLVYELAAVSNTRGEVLGAVVGESSATVRLRDGGVRMDTPGLKNVDGVLYETTTVPIHARSEIAGNLTVGARFNLDAFKHGGEAGLLRDGRLVESTLTKAQNAEVERQLRPACARTGCELRISGADYAVAPIARTPSGASLGPSHQLFSIRSIDKESATLTRGFRLVLAMIGVLCALAAICISALASRTVSKPLKELAAHIENCEAGGRYLVDFPVNSPTREVNLVAASLNRASHTLRHSQASLDNVYLEFVETMAQALDARDPYTAGHSNRVSQYSAAIAKEMRLAPAEAELIRIGAQLHDIGKIGIPDQLLQKPGYLTPEEYEIVKLHPQIGKRILERVGQFAKFLPIVELHHEDQDGRGYPYGLKGREIPLAVRIVHVADVFDALTSNRAYRNAIPPVRAFETLEACAGTHFDRDVVSAFAAVLASRGILEEIGLEQLALEQLAPVPVLRA